jgi:hypothetical protein
LPMFVARKGTFHEKYRRNRGFCTALARPWAGTLIDRSNQAEKIS